MNRCPMNRLSIAICGTAMLAGCAAMSAPEPIAVGILNPTQGNTAKGTVSFVQKSGQILVDARIEGLAPGPHGFHIHEKGDCSAPDATSAGGHFNPGATPHGDPAHADHHAGDFGNLTADANGKAELKLTLPASQVTLGKDGPNSIIGKGLVVHADPDDYKTQPTGNSGKRVACGVIALS
jgi:superoxide dismutase, Cu-Zn family